MNALSKNQRIIKNENEMQIPITEIIIVNADLEKQDLLNTEMKKDPQLCAYKNEIWETTEEFEKSLLNKGDLKSTLYILCVTDHSAEVLDFIPTLYERSASIIVIDDKTIQIPALWLNYFSMGASACLFQCPTKEIHDAIMATQQGQGYLSTPQHATQIFVDATKSININILKQLTPIELSFIDVLWDSEIINDIGPVIEMHLNLIKESILNKVKLSTLSETLIHIIQIRWQEKQEKMQKHKKKVR